ncbi:MAG: TetR/AcrR family transcriptional regulator, partial [Arcobacter sp.]|nr:TetR/AcrR family transcriptional regulator [Arcobacter sp.]
MEKNTRKNLIDSTFDEIYQKGYQGASLTTILKNAKVHKGSMYHFFENKKEMALVSIKEKIYERFVQRYSSIIALESGYLEAFIKSIKDTTNRDFNKGCPIANIVQEMSNIDEDFKVLMEEIYQTFRKNIKD